MRCIGNIAEHKQAERFVCFLDAQHIEAALRAGQDTGYAVWVFEEERVDAARQELAAFLASPDDQRFQRARPPQAGRTPTEYWRLVKGRTDLFGGRRLAPGSVTILMIALSTVVTLLSFLPAFAPLTAALYFSRYVGTSFPEMQSGQIWRLVTPIFLHANMMHLVFNMLWLYQLGRQIEAQESSGYFAMLVLVLAVICNTGQYLVSGPLFVGMSGVVYGLLGYIWMMTRFHLGTVYLLSQQTVMFMLLWLGLCLVQIIPHVANTEHVLGLLAGVGWGVVRSGAWSERRRRRQWRQPRP